MPILVVGASGATGRLLLAELLNHGHAVRAVVRSPDRVPAALRDYPLLNLHHANLLDQSDEEMSEIVRDCHAVASCLGHHLSFRGIYGSPRRLVTDATRRLCEAIRATPSQAPLRFVLMNTAGNRNRDLAEPISFSHRCVIGLIRLLLPPHADNEQAAEYLRVGIDRTDPFIQWAVVRPDTLINEDQRSAYAVYPSPTRSAIFNAGKTSRINVAHFMANLLTDDETWRKWQGQMPVVYNKEHS